MLRPGRRGELPELAALDARAFPNGWHMSAGQLGNQYYADRERILVAGQGDLMIGFVLLSEVLRGVNHDGFVVRLAVLPDWQRMGVGTDLMMGAVRSLRGAGMARVGLNVRASNTLALAFYERLGFTQHRPPTAILGTMTNRDWEATP